MTDQTSSTAEHYWLDGRVVRAAIAAVGAAAVVCRGVQHAQATVRSVLKDDRSPVTIADFASQAVVAHWLTTALGEVMLVAEEDVAFLQDGGRQEYRSAVLRAVHAVWPEADESAILAALTTGPARTTPGGGFWTLDPIDGTKGFLRNQQYAISLAFIQQGRPTLGVLACPNLSRDPGVSPEEAVDSGLICVAAAGQGSFDLSAEPGQPARPLAVSANAPDGEIRICSSVERGHGDSAQMEHLLRCLDRPHRLLGVDSQCKYAAVARGQADAYIRIPFGGYVEWIWDHAAGALVAMEAGCLVTDVLGRTLDFSAGRRLENNIGIICAPPPLHALLLESAAAAGIGRSSR